MIWYAACFVLGVVVTVGVAYFVFKNNKDKFIAELQKLDLTSLNPDALKKAVQDLIAKYLKK